MEPNPEQCDAIESEGHLAVIASAGTGKTTVLTRRFARHLAQGIPPSRLLAFTFTEKAAREMKDRILALAEFGPETLPELNVSTVHAFCGDVLRHHGELLGLNSDFAILDERAHAAMTRSRFKIHAHRALAAGDAVFVEFYTRYGMRRLLNSMEELGSLNLVLLADESLSCHGEAFDAAMTAFVAANRNLQETLSEERVANGTLSYDDLETLVIRLLRNHPSVKNKLRNRFDRILIDEFQDTSPRQFEIVKHIFAPGRNELFAVGDPKQAIYGFRHADADTFDALQRLVVENGGRVIALTRTFRTPGKLNDFFNAVFPAMLNRSDNPLYYAAVTVNPEEGTVSASPESGAPSGEDEDAAGLDENVARYAAGLVTAGEDASSIAILAPTRKHFENVAAAIEKRGLTATTERRADPFENDLTLFFFHALTALSGHADKITVSGLLRNPLAGFSETLIAAALASDTVNPLASLTADGIAAASPEESARWAVWHNAWLEIAEAAAHLSAAEVCAALFRFVLPEANAGQLKTFAEFCAILESWRRQGAYSASQAAELLRELADGGAETKIPSIEEKGVRLLTVHGAKGLEFRHILVIPGGRDAANRVPFLWDKDFGFAFKTPDVGPESGLGAELKDSAAYARLRSSMEPAERAETARLVYVALTRSRGRLHVFAPKARSREFAAALAKNQDDVTPVKGFNDWLYWLSLRPGIATQPAFPTPGPRTEAEQGGTGAIPTESTEPPRHHAVPNPVLSVTALETFARCPKKYRLAYVENRAPSVRGESARARRGPSAASGEWSSLDPALRGTLLHEVLQFYEPARGNLDEVIDQALFNQRLADENGELRAACREFAAKLRADPETNATLFGCHETHRELEFSLELNGFVLSGQIDKLALIPSPEGDYEWVVIDYKTHALRSAKEAEALAAGFAFQLKCYALAVARRFGQKDVTAAIAFTAIGRTVRLKFPEAELRSFEAGLDATLMRWQESLAKREFAFTENAKHCETCPYFAGNDCGVRRGQ